MSRLNQFLLVNAFIAVFDTSLKTSPAIIQRDLIWTALVFAGIAVWDYFANRPDEKQASEKI